MKIEFLVRKPENRRLLLIFAGWGTDATFYSYIQDILPKGWNLCVASDYDDFEFPHEILKGYYAVYLVAWSLGVVVSELTLNPEDITRAIAINGTLRPADDNFGIPEAIYNSTAANLTEASLKKFRRRMFSSAEEFFKMLPLLPDSPDIEKLRSQLFSLQDKKPEVSLPWTRVYIGENDLIFPSASQVSFWSGVLNDEEKIVKLDASHYIDFKKVLRAVLHDTEHIGGSFARAVDTYDANAIAQRRIAETLSGYVRRNLPEGNLHNAEEKTLKKILEIGHGTGLLTRLYTEFIKPDEIIFIDLYPVEKFGLAPREEYVIGDAEEWVDQTYEKFDAILSASAIQWFVNPEKFFKNAARILNGCGILAVSTFLPGNLSELRVLRPDNMIYPSASELRNWVKKYFREVEVVEDRITLEFPSSREAIMNLRATGVAPKKSGSSYPANLSDLPARLTYRSVYIIARK